MASTVTMARESRKGRHRRTPPGASRFREALARGRIDGAPAIQGLFSAYETTLREAGFLAMGGEIVDATGVAAPRPRNIEAGTAESKAGRIPKAWREKPARLARKDRDARRAIKRSKPKPAQDGSKRVDIDDADAVPAGALRRLVPPLGSVGVILAGMLLSAIV